MKNNCLYNITLDKLVIDDSEPTAVNASSDFSPATRSRSTQIAKQLQSQRGEGRERQVCVGENQVFG